MNEILTIAMLEVNGIYVVAMASICLLQYFTYTHWIDRERLRNNELQKTAGAFESEVRELERKQSLVGKERAALAALHEYDDLSRGMLNFLRRLTNNSGQGAGLVLSIIDDRFDVLASRSIPASVTSNLGGLAADLNVFADDSAYRRTTWDEFVRHPALEALQQWSYPQEVCHVFRIGPADAPRGVVATSALFDGTALQSEQPEVAERLARGLAPSFRGFQTMAAQVKRLEYTEAMLRLRTITDCVATHRVETVDRFLQMLLEEIGAERGILKLSLSQDRQAWVRRVCVPDTGLSPPIVTRWEAIEERLVDAGRLSRECQWYDRAELAAVGVESLIGKAVTVPMAFQGKALGVLGLSSRGNTFGEQEAPLLEWAAGHLCEFLIRSLNVAAIEKLAREDGLTELANRRAFDNKLHDELEACRQARVECTLLLFDLDRFKLVNDEYGHQAGDAVLKQTAKLLRDEVTCMRGSDRAVLARYGGEEMVVLLPGVPLAGAARVAESIRRRVADHLFEYAGQVMPITLSVGVGGFPQHGTTATELIAAADAGLYEAKRSGRNRICVPMGALVANPV